MKLLTKGNKKLPTSTAIFNLPAVRTCPGCTKKCVKWCYARKAERIYPNVLPFRMNNWDESKKDTFTSQINGELKRSRTVTTVRIHESGDFYTEEYFRKWLKIAQENKTLQFYAYTKVVTLGSIARPANFILLLSDDDELLKQHWPDFDGVTTVTPRKGTPKKGWFVCPGSCKSCDYCYDPTVTKKKLTFEEH